MTGSNKNVEKQMLVKPGIVVALDIGNSQLTAGIFEAGILKSHFYCQSKNAAESVDRIMHLKPSSVIISSVVPEQSEDVRKLLTAQGVVPSLLKSGDSGTIKGCYSTMGSDRIANLIAARTLFGTDKAHIIVDCGTATTLSAVSADGVFAGGFITLGYGATLDMLSKRTAQLPLPDADLAQVDELGFNTESSILNGTILAQIATIDLWIFKAKQSLRKGEIAETFEVTATGGWCQEIASRSDMVDRIDPLLTIKGVYLSGAVGAVPGDLA